MTSPSSTWLHITPITLLLSMMLLLADPVRSARPPALDLDFDKTLQRTPGDRYHRARVEDKDWLGMMEKWMDTGYSSLFSAIANQKLKKQRRSVSLRFGACSSQADEVGAHARCVSKLLRHEFATDEHRTGPKKRDKLARLARYRKWSPGNDTVGGFRLRQKREATNKVRQSDGYRLLTDKPQMTIAGQIARMLLEQVKTASHKEHIPKWQDTVQKLRENGGLVKERKKKLEAEMDSSETLNSLAFRAVKEQQKGEGQEDVEEQPDLEDLHKDRTKLDKFLRAQQRKKKGQGKEQKVMDLIREAVKLGYSLAGQNVTDFDRKGLKLASPRFLGLVPEQSNDNDTEISLISPSLFSLHNEGEGLENLTSLPNLLRGVPLGDQQLWLDIIMEAAGVNEHSEKLEQEARDLGADAAGQLLFNVSRLSDEDGTPRYATPKNATDLGADPVVLDMFERLHSSYSQKQQHEMNTTGFAVLDKHQIELLYGPGSLANNSAVHARLMNMTEAEVLEQVERDIHAMAKAPDGVKSRKKRDVVLAVTAFTWVTLAPATVSQPFILSPVIFSPLILSPAIYGPLILTPWIFTPLVLSPRVMSPLIIAPWIFGPIILSPLALHPAILSPGVFNPLILTPMVLTPFILSPQVFTPLILTPLCLCPIILNPLVGSPLILSPFVLTPTILSPHALGGLIMSPYALSPVILSPLIIFAAILSPSFLS